MIGAAADSQLFYGRRKSPPPKLHTFDANHWNRVSHLGFPTPMPGDRTRGESVLRVCSGVAIGLLLAFSGGSTAAIGQVRDATEDRRQLEATRHQLEEAREAKNLALQRDKVIQADMAQDLKERESLNSRLLETAKQIQGSEAKLTALEQRQGELEAQEKFIRGSLETSHGSISGLLAAMQRMGRNPPPVMVTRREDALSMVRSAMLLASAFPEMRGKALELTAKLNDLVRLLDEQRSSVEQHKLETSRLQDNKLLLASQIEQKKQSLAERQKELAQVRKDATEFSRNVSDLNELIGKLDKSVSEKTRLGVYEKQLAADALLKQQQGAIDAADGSKSAGEIANKKLASVGKPPDDLRPSITLQPGEKHLMAAPGRIQPSIPFEASRGRLVFPAQGRQIQGYGDKAQSGRSDGIVIETRAGAQVVSPNDGWVMYAGEFRSYGQILIINAGGGYNILLAGLSQIDVQVGQFVLSGEPVGLMVAAPKIASQKTQETAPVLYVEFRKNQKPVDPGPWWAETARKVAG